MKENIFNIYFIIYFYFYVGNPLNATLTNINELK